MPNLLAGLHNSTLYALHMAGDAGASSNGMYDHVQCLTERMPDDLTAEQRDCMEAFIKARSNIFSSSEYDISHISILPHRIDAGDNALHLQSLDPRSPDHDPGSLVAVWTIRVASCIVVRWLNIESRPHISSLHT